MPIEVSTPPWLPSCPD